MRIIEEDDLYDMYMPELKELRKKIRKEVMQMHYISDVMEYQENVEGYRDKFIEDVLDDIMKAVKDFLP